MKRNIFYNCVKIEKSEERRGKSGTGGLAAFSV